MARRILREEFGGLPVTPILAQQSTVLATTLLGAGFALALFVSLHLSASHSLASTIWLGNGLQLGALLLTPRRRWTPLLAGLTLISATMMLLAGRSPAESLATSAVNLGEVLLAATMLRRDPDWIAGRSDSVLSWLRFAGWGVLAAPLAGTALGVLTLITVFHQRMGPGAIWRSGHVWYITDAVAICVIVPVMIRLGPAARDQVRAPDRVRELTGLTLLLAATATAVMCQSSVIALFGITLPLVVLVFRLGFAGVAAGMAVLCAVLLGFTRAGTGPFLTMAADAPGQALLLAQLFLMAMFATVVLIGALLDERQQLAARESANEQVYRMIAATSSDLILVLGDDCSARYVSPAASDLAGRPDTALVGMGWLEQVHAEDRDDLVAAFNAVRDGRATEGEAVCRLLRREGDWRWLEFRLRRSRSPELSGAQRLGAVPAVDAGLTVATVRDVTGRKEHEETLRAENLQLAQEATTDALTGLANRREFEHRLGVEWRRALRSKQPLSLLVIDIDHFKEFNDTYGHADGDTCLAEVAQALRSALRRPSDLCARYGGEEFVALLPNTGRAGGQAVALALCAAVRRLQIEHPGNEPGCVTVSVGSATTVPEGPGAPELFAQADLALYRAKAAGRDRAEVFDDVLDLQGEDDGTGVDHITGLATG